MSSLVLPENFQTIHRVQNTSLPGNELICLAITKIPGVGRRFADIVVKKAGVSINKRCGECSDEEMNKIVEVMNKPLEYGIPVWFLNHRRLHATNEPKHNVGAGEVSSALRDDIIRLQKIKANRGLRHGWGYRVRGQHTGQTGRRGAIVANKKK